MDRSARTAIAWVCFLAVAPMAKAQARYASSNEWLQQVEVLLAANDREVRDMGFALTHRPFYDRLRDGHYMTIDVDLDEGTHYAFLGVCDDDCSDLDFRLYDENWKEVAHDTDPDDTPVVQVTPIRSARFHLRVIMASCDADPCWWGVGVYGR